MAGTLSFKVSEVRRLVEHSRAAKKHVPSYEDLFNPAYHRGGKVKKDENDWPDRDNIDINLIPAGLQLVKDQGVYLMSNGSPSLLVEGDGNRHVVSYAKEANPETLEFDDWWEASRRIMGGDDCVATLPITMFEPVLALLSDDDTLKVKVTSRHIQVLMPKPKKR